MSDNSRGFANLEKYIRFKNKFVGQRRLPLVFQIIGNSFLWIKTLRGDAQLAEMKFMLAYRSRAEVCDGAHFILIDGSFFSWRKHTDRIMVQQKN